MTERKGQRILLTAAFVLTTQLPGEHDHPSSSTNTPTGTNQPGLPTEVGEYKKPQDLTIVNLVRQLEKHNLNFEIEITAPINGEIHTFFCRPGYHSCLWYPPDNSDNPGAQDVHLVNLDIMLATGSTFTIMESPDASLRVNQAVFMSTFEVFNEASFTLQNPQDALDGDYLKGGSTFAIENNSISTPQSLA